MIPSVREAYNRQFTPEKYRSFLEDLDRPHPGALAFRVAETPVFVPASFTEKMIAAGEEVMDMILHPDFRALTQKAVPDHYAMPGESSRCEFICLDFAVGLDEHGALTPQLIELQGFATILAFQALLASSYRENFAIPAYLHNYFNGYTDHSYRDLLQRMILGGHAPENVILLDIRPQEQQTRIDFYLTQDITGIQPVCITELTAEGGKLFYYRSGERIEVKRIYNRLIFDDLERQKRSLGKLVDLTADLAVEWVPHPDWFYRISKYVLPFIKSEYVPVTHFLHRLPVIPKDLENYVLKPLFSFAGQGVLTAVTREDIEKITDPHHWILQRKVQYASVIATPDIPAKCELRLMYFWEDGAPRPLLVNNLARLSKGKMMGVQYNTDQEWVGVGIGFFEGADKNFHEQAG